MSSHDIEIDSNPTLEVLGQALDDLPGQGHIYENDVCSATDARRVKISRTYLWLLGYLKNDNRKEKIDREYRDAIDRFQHDIGVQASGKAGDRTWKALQQLAPYDTDTNVGRWLRRETMSPAFKRAVHLRLFSYGLLKTAPSHKDLSGNKLKKADKALQGALEHFARVASLLGFVSEPLSPTLNMALVRLLFDQDGMVRRLRPKGEKFDVFAPNPHLPLDTTKSKKILKAFLGNLALVEMWLLGYEVRPGNFKSEGPHAAESSNTLNLALTKFAADRSIDLPNRQSIKVGVWFFIEARKIQTHPEDAGQIDDEKIKQLAADRKRLRKLKKSYTSLGARIIDGVKRAISWVFGWFRSAFRVVKQLIRNLARALHKGAVAAYKRLRAIFESFGVAFSYFFGKVVKGSDLRTVYVRKMADFDMNVFVNERATATEVDNFFTALQLRVRAMELVGHIIGKLLALIRFISSVTGPVVGWLRLVMSLARLANWFRTTRALIDETVALMRKLDELEPATA